jgi:hypothetical protein
MYHITTDIAYTSTKSEIESFASTYDSTITEFKTNGPAGGNHLVKFSSYTYESIKKICGEFNIPSSKIIRSL